MEIKVKNLGVLKQAEFTLGDLTIICGGNNSGKTYATYALFGFLDNWDSFVSIEISSASIEQLLAKGVVKVDFQQYVKNIDMIIADACSKYSQKIDEVFAAPEERFNETEFHMSLDTRNIRLTEQFESTASSATNKEFLSIVKNVGSSELIITLLAFQDNIEIPTHIIAHFISEAIKNIIFQRNLPRPFIVSAERTGAVTFRKELNFSRNRLLERMTQAHSDMDRIQILFKGYKDYPLPVKKNVDFTRNLESIFKKNSFITEHHPDILTDFADIIGGEYMVNREDELYYIPKQGKRIKLSMDSSSSAVRSLLDIGFYLRHEAQKGDLLMVDEPELNLHPENQRRIARLFARLINIGIKVFITTHSDYIVKELNTLIMLNHDRPHLKQLAEDEGYLPAELLSADRIKVYIAEEALVKVDGKTRKVKVPTLTEAKIDSERGIEARSFDKTIDDMNRIQDAIVWGGE
ncbi:AAA family ATPase [Chamaesiphon sp.]|uniref:AAA family ATPase n=1 Tax=Chamaesiphon sp. TaxID=2814140 RepID=UPI003593E0A6